MCLYFKAGSFEVQPRPEYAAPRELQPAVLTGALRKSALSVRRCRLNTSG